MKFDLRTPCKNCPFRTDETAIRFACRERAVEIEESAYRNGFPCHLSADFDEDEDDGGYVFGDNTQHCAGATIMYLQGGASGNVPFEWLPERKQDAITDRLDFDAPVYDSPDDFLDSYGGDEEEQAA